MNSEARRKKRNKELIERVKRGESVALIDTRATWYPPRPIIEKDKDAIKRLYRNKEG